MMRKTFVVAAIAIATFALGATGMVGVAEASYCGIGISYSDVGPIPKGTTGSILPTVSRGYCTEIDDPRTYSLTSGPSWVSVNSFNGRVSYDTTDVPFGTYHVTVSVTWNCVCTNGYDSDTFTITVC